MRPSRGGTSTLILQGYAAAIREHQQCSFLVFPEPSHASSIALGGRRLGCITANTQVQKTAVASVHNAPSDEDVQNSHTILHVFIEVRTCYILALPYVMLIPGFCAVCSCLFFHVHLIRHGRYQRSPCSVFRLCPPCRHSMQSISYPYLALSTLPQVHETVQPSSAQCAGRRPGSGEDLYINDLAGLLLLGRKLV